MARGAPSVPANRDGMGGNVLLNNGAGILGTTVLPKLPAHQSAITFSKQVIMQHYLFTGLTVYHAATDAGQPWTRFISFVLHY